jgi:tRNA-guanine family transglycosylase
MKIMASIYLPVTKFEKIPFHRFFNIDNPYFNYPNIIVTPFVTGMNRTKEEFKDAKIYADSGGFQIVTLGKKVKTLDILYWQQNIADVSFTVDIPPHSFGDNFTRDQFLKCMKKSNKNADIMKALKTNEKMQLWAVIQGTTIEELSLWYNNISDREEYPGFCISLSIHKSGKNIPYIEQLEFAKTIKKPIHFFGYSDNLFALILARFSRLTKQTYTYDSSTSTIGDRYGKYIDPINFKHISFSLKNRPPTLICKCPICTKYAARQLQFNTSLINLHNLYIKIKFCEFANIVSEYDELFVSVLDKYIPDDKNHDEIRSKALNLLFKKIPDVNKQVAEEQKQQIPEEFRQWL